MLHNDMKRFEASSGTTITGEREVGRLFGVLRRPEPALYYFRIVTSFLSSKKEWKDIKNEFNKTKIWESNRLKDEPIGLDGLRHLAREIYGIANAKEILYP